MGILTREVFFEEDVGIAHLGRVFYKGHVTMFNLP